jgi:hypothetical protein
MKKILFTIFIVGCCFISVQMLRSNIKCELDFQTKREICQITYFKNDYYVSKQCISKKCELFDTIHQNMNFLTLNKNPDSQTLCEKMAKGSYDTIYLYFNDNANLAIDGCTSGNQFIESAYLRQIYNSKKL